jgi:endogenous inhibitor of DNA gyrase (YacG/DUF329 family)
MKPLKCPQCGGHVSRENTVTHMTTDRTGRLVVVGRDFCSEKCGDDAGADWRKKNGLTPVPAQKIVRTHREPELEAKRAKLRAGRR